MKRTSLSVAAAAVGLVLASTIMAGPANAAGGYNATVAGQPNGTPLVNLATSSTQTVDVVNLPANVGIYGLQCKVPADPRQAPTLCDSSSKSLYYLLAEPTDRATASFPLKVNAEFWGTNPNPTAGPSLGQSVDCRAATGDPRATTCAVYVMGAGKDSANPAYIRFFPTVYSPVKSDRKNDVATITYNGATLARGAKAKLSLAKPGTFSVATASGLVPDVVGDRCSVKDGKITALQANGACVVRMTTNGGINYKPLVQVQVFKLTK
jgi:hypothetical protein